MPRIVLDEVGITYTIRFAHRVSFKEVLVRSFKRGANPGPTRVEALKGVTLNIEKGERVGMIGRNGAGKSSLLKLMAGVYTPTTGTRTVEGSIGSLFDISLGFEPDATGRENIAYRSYLQGETPKTLKPKFNDIASFSELGEFLDVPVRNYSAGMVTRLAFAISTAIEPDVLLIDEVFSAGDAGFQRKAHQRMRDMIGQAGIVVMISHDMNTIKQFCDRVIWLSDGRVHRDGPAHEVIDEFTEYFANEPPAPAAEAA
ncbi:Teichoic acids export ATP-binding protein TagH [Planctomycetes bacterium Pan216]|uniref:Teichoic acids export ATP-binding protein TagH n=1 Tax=Kolteria novifilia TaxID=2527975 RepID=A0A518BD76_9BACT|nr:Teichoic acids export ATP-binding protein TagH [Planctomycetes bacterium Pan216]